MISPEQFTQEMMMAQTICAMEKQANIQQKILDEMKKQAVKMKCLLTTNLLQFSAQHADKHDCMRQHCMLLVSIIR